MEAILIGLIFIIGIISIIVGFWELFVYFRLSFARRQNSRDFNGIQVAEEVLKKSGDDDIKVSSNFWSLTYINYSNATKTLKLGRIDSRRKSIWTVATSGRQAYSASVLKRASMGEKPPISTFWFKLQTFWFGMFMSMVFNFGIIISGSLWIANSIDDNIFNLWFFVFMGIILIIPLIYALASFKTSKLMYENANEIFGGIFSEEEIGQIKHLWKLEYINAIIELVKVVLVIILSILNIIRKAQD